MKDSFNLMNLFKAIRTYWLLILIIIIGSVAITFGVVSTLPPSYEAMGYIRIGIVADRIIENPITLKQYLKTPEKIKSMADRTGLSYKDIEDGLIVDVVQNPDREKAVMQVLKLTATYNDAQKAADIVDAAMIEIEQMVKDKYVMWEMSLRKGVTRIRKASDNMSTQLQVFTQGGQGSGLMGSKPTDQYTAMAQGLAAGNGMMAQAQILRLEAEQSALLEQKTYDTQRLVNPIPPPEPEHSYKSLILLVSLATSIILALLIAMSLYNRSSKKP